MPTPILRTKLYFPTPRPSLVARPRLVERLEQGLQGPLTLISAPAGSGKTTLLSEWRAAKGARMPVAWLSLDPSDNDPARFLTYLVAALETLQPGLASGVGSLLEAGELPALKVITTSLIIDLQDFPQDFALVLDDYHVINDQAIHQAFIQFVDNLPPQMHLILLTRADPPFPLALLRARGHLTEIRLAQLRFTEFEAAAFLNDVMGLDLTPQQIAALEDRAEGWIAGLQLAALSMQGQDPASRAEFIQAFTGSHHYILDFLSEEALNRQSPEIQRFLLRTSVLERLCGSSCDALTGRDDGVDTLAQLERGNLFLIPLDDERHWYRYHHLFADMLSNRLRTTYPDELSSLHLAASAWYERAGLSDEAIRHALSADDYNRAAYLLRQNHLQVMYTRPVSTLGSWLAAFPEPVIRDDPWLGIARLHQMWSTGQRDGLAERASEAQTALQEKLARGEMSVDDPDYNWLWAETLSFQSLSRQQEDTPEAVSLALKAVDLVPPQVFPLGFALGALYSAYRRAGQIELSAETCRKAIQVTRRLRYPSMLATATASLGLMLIEKGQLREAVRVHQETLQFAKDHGMEEMFYFGIVHTSLAEFLREWNQLEEAETHLNHGLSMIRQGGLNILLIPGLVTRARLRLSQGDPAGALAALEELRHECRSMDPDIYQQASQTLRIRCLADLGEFDELTAWVADEDLSLGTRISLDRGREMLLAGHCLALLGRSDEAVPILEHLERFARENDYTGMLIQVLVSQAVNWEILGETGPALGCLDQALELTETEGYTRVFVDEGERMRELLEKARQKEIKLVYVTRLLAVYSAQQAATLLATKASALLSPRELELLTLIAAGRTNREIAGELYIAIGTVKRHTVNIYTKLNAANRTEAVAKAREIGLLQ